MVWFTVNELYFISLWVLRSFGDEYKINFSSCAMIKRRGIPLFPFVQLCMFEETVSNPLWANAEVIACRMLPLDVPDAAIQIMPLVNLRKGSASLSTPAIVVGCKLMYSKRFANET